MSPRCLLLFLCGCLALIAVELESGCALLWRSIDQPSLRVAELAWPLASTRGSALAGSAEAVLQAEGQSRAKSAGRSRRAKSAGLQQTAQLNSLDASQQFEEGRLEHGSIGAESMLLVALESQP